MSEPAQEPERQDQPDRMPPWIPRLLVTIVVTGFLSWGALLVLQKVAGLIYILIMALFLSFALEPAVNWLARRGWRRGAGAGFVLFALFLVSLVIIGLLVPVIISETRQFIDALPGWLHQLSRTARSCCNVDLSTDKLQHQLSGAKVNIAGYVSGIAGNVLAVGAAVLGLIFQVLTVALFTFYLTANGPKIRRAVCSLLPQERQQSVLFAWETAIDKTGGYFYSRLLLAVINGGLLFVVLLVLGVPFALPLAIFAGLLSEFIPIVGTYVGVAIPALVALANDPLDAVWVVVYATVYQQVENAWLSPKISSQTMELNAGVAFGAAIAGASIGGFIGAFMALPVAAVVQALLSEYAKRHEVVESDLTRLDVEREDRPKSGERRRPLWARMWPSGRAGSQPRRAGR